MLRCLSFRNGRSIASRHKGNTTRLRIPITHSETERRIRGDGWARNPRRDGSPPLTSSQAQWLWDELYYGKEYPSKLAIKNWCPGNQQVYIFINGLPYLTMPSSVLVPGNGELEVSAMITAPPEPPMPPMIAGANPPGWGWVEPPTIINVAPDSPMFHQPNFVDITGNVRRLASMER